MAYQYTLVYLPDIQPASFLLCTHSPDGATQLRDYSSGSQKKIGQPPWKEVFAATLEGVTRFPVDAHQTSDVGYWHRLTLTMNRTIAGVSEATAAMEARPAPPPRPGPSPAPSGRAPRGSRRQLQDYINLHPDMISAAILAGLPAGRGATIRWVSPLAEDNYQEYRDAEFLERLGLKRLVPDLEEFWPNSGPCWDALGIVHAPGEELDGGVILVEAKSHRGEVQGTGCMAENQRSISRIRAALAETKKLCGADPGADWMGSLYQSANRLAHLHFLLERLNGSAWLVNLCFVGDPIGRTTVEEWEHDIAENRRLMGLSSPVPNCLDVFLPALDAKSTAPDAVRVEPRVILPTEARSGSETAGDFGSWLKRWSELARYTGVELADFEQRRRGLVQLWNMPVPGGWKRGIDTQLLGSRYRRGDASRLGNREHRIEHEILEEFFSEVNVLGGKLVDGINALPLTKDNRGGRTGNVEADLYLLVQKDSGYRLYVVEVKFDADHAWLATVENFRQLRLLQESKEALRLFQRRNPALELPDIIPVSGLVLAPGSYYSDRGRKSKSTLHAKQLIDEMRAECGCRVRLAVWDPDRKSIDLVG